MPVKVNQVKLVQCLEQQEGIKLVGLPRLLSSLTANSSVCLEPRVWGRGRQEEQE